MQNHSSLKVDSLVMGLGLVHRKANVKASTNRLGPEAFVLLQPMQQDLNHRKLSAAFNGLAAARDVIYMQA